MYQAKFFSVPYADCAPWEQKIISGTAQFWNWDLDKFLNSFDDVDFEAMKEYLADLGEDFVFDLSDDEKQEDFDYWKSSLIQKTIVGIIYESCREDDRDSITIYASLLKHIL